MQRLLVASSLIVAILTTITPHARADISSRLCPYSCRTEGIPKERCRDWREGSICYVEDLRRPREPEPKRRAPPPVAAPYGYPPRVPPSDAPRHGGCREARRYDLVPPRIELYRVKHTGNFFGSQVKVSGSIEGTCLVEAGSFENGRLREGIPVPTTRSFGRYDFTVVVDRDEVAQIRAYNIVGESAVVRVRDTGWDEERPRHPSRDRYDDDYRYPYDPDRYERRPARRDGGGYYR